MYSKLMFKLLLILSLVTLSNKVLSDPLLLPFAHNKEVKVCQFVQSITSLPSFNEPSCYSTLLSKVDTQNTELWLLIEFEWSEHYKKLSKPYGLYLFGKTASHVYLNGQSIGLNGQPSDEQSELVGQMDTVFYVPESLLLKQNQLIMHLSGHHSIIQLGYPIHFIGFGQYGEPKRFVQTFSALGLVLIGAFSVGALYFLSLSFGKQSHNSSKIFTALCLLAALQLGIEMSRGLMGYEYPFHDIRLLLVTLLSFVFGILLLTYSSLKVAGTRALHWIYIGIIVTLGVIIFIPGFDAKTTAGIFIPLLVSVNQLIYYWWLSRNKHILNWFVVQLIVALTIFVSASSFHEMTYFAVIGVLLCYLFVQQAKEFKQQQELLNSEQARIAKLEFKLSQNFQSQSPTKIDVSIAGKTEFIAANDISFCKAAGDYVELTMIDNSEKLFSGSLKQLESVLPTTFIKVHRSYIVNLNEVVSLDGKSAEGSIMLCLANKKRVPVSRRLVPAVRASLKQSQNG